MTPEELLIVKRVARDFRDSYSYWARHFANIVDKASGRVIKLSLNAVQSQIGAIERHLIKTKGRARIYILKARQAGITTDQQARNMHKIWSTPHCNVMTLSQDLGSTNKIFEITKRLLTNFPIEVEIPGVSDPVSFVQRWGDRQASMVELPDMDSRFWTGTAGSKTVGRGTTLNRLHASEFAFWEPDPMENLAALLPTIDRPGTSVVLETTASVYGGEVHEFWRRAEKGDSEFLALFFPWWETDFANQLRLPLIEDDELEPLMDDEVDLINLHDLTLEQIKWRRQTMATMGKAQFMKEYAEDPESCWLAAGDNVYDVELLKNLMGRAPGPHRRIQHLGGELQLFYDEKRKPEGPVIIGADTAEGVGGDRSSWVARLLKDWKLLAKFSSNRITPEQFADHLNEWGRKLNYATLVIEKNMHGITVIRRVRDLHKYKLNRIYHRLPSFSRVTDRIADYIGWHTSEESKPLMISAGRLLFEAAAQGHAQVPAAEVISDAFSVAYNKNTGKIDLGGRDELVAEMLAWIGRDQFERMQVRVPEKPVQWG